MDVRINRKFNLSKLLLAKIVCFVIKMLAAWSVKTIVIFFAASIKWRIFRITHTKPIISTSVGQCLVSASLSIRLKKNGLDIWTFRFFGVQILSGKPLPRIHVVWMHLYQYKKNSLEKWIKNQFVKNIPGINGMIRIFQWLGFPRLFFVKIFSVSYFCWMVILHINEKTILLINPIVSNVIYIFLEFSQIFMGKRFFYFKTMILFWIVCFLLWSPKLTSRHCKNLSTVLIFRTLLKFILKKSGLGQKFWNAKKRIF